MDNKKNNYLGDNKIADKIKKMLTGKKGKDGMIILILIGVLIAVIAIPTEEKKEEAQEMPDVGVTGETNDEAYETRLENRLEEILSCMDGVGKVEVMITLQASSKEVVEKDISSQQNNERGEETLDTIHIMKEENTVYTEDGNASIPYVVQEIYPEIEGVLVVAEGGDNSYVNLAIVDAIQALFDVDVHKIKIVKMNTN